MIERGSHYVAMGSSFGAGPGLLPRAEGSPRPSGRSAVNYAHLLAGELGLALSDVTYSGATTADILATSAAVTPAQIGAVTAATRLVTITAGGNDIGYLPAITLSSFPGPLRSLPAIRRRIAAATEPAATARFAQLHDSLTQIVERIRERSPDAVIVIVDYLTILPSDLSLTGSKPPLAVGRWALESAARLTDTFSSVATETGCQFLAVGQASLDHHAWAAEPWTRQFHYSLRGGAPFHPTAAGMSAVASLLAAQLAA